MRCPECGHTNVPGSLFCERCGGDLGAAESLVAAEDPPAEGATGWVCPACERFNRLDNLVCESCGHRRVRPEPDAAPAPPPAAEEEPQPRRMETTVGARPAVETDAEPVPTPVTTPGQLVTGPRQGKVKLVVEQGMVVGKQFLLNSDSLVVGREDASENFYPDLDLTGLDEGYVHRRHARLSFEGSFLFVTHLGGHNKTFVNNKPIADNLAHPLNIGDTVRFGKVLLRLVEA